MKLIFFWNWLFLRSRKDWCWFVLIFPHRTSDILTYTSSWPVWVINWLVNPGMFKMCWVAGSWIYRVRNRTGRRCRQGTCGLANSWAKRVAHCPPACQWCDVKLAWLSQPRDLGFLGEQQDPHGSHLYYWVSALIVFAENTAPPKS